MTSSAPSPSPSPSPIPKPSPARTYRLIGPDGVECFSTKKGTLGGHRGTRIYGRLDCPAAARAIARAGPYPKFRVFFAEEATAISAGYRPCAVCMRPQYDVWKRGRS